MSNPLIKDKFGIKFIALMLFVFISLSGCNGQLGPTGKAVLDSKLNASKVTTAAVTQLKSCAVQNGFICKDDEKCSGEKLNASDSGICCSAACTKKDLCKDVTCRSTEKCIDGKCALKTCEEAKGAYCGPNSQCMKLGSTKFTGTEFTDSEGKTCCLDECKTQCQLNPCYPNQKCVDGKCVVKTCAEQEGYDCNADNLLVCSSRVIDSSDVSACCLKPCTKACSPQCPANQKCSNGQCAYKTCAEQGGYICDSGTKCNAELLTTSDSVSCCSQSCVNQCEIQPCAPNQKCVNGECVYKTCAEQSGVLCDVYQHYDCVGTITESSEGQNSYQYVCCKGECTSYEDECVDDSDCDDGDPNTVDTCSGSPKKCNYVSA